MKDPHNTVQRLSGALESLATGVGDRERFESLLTWLMPLRPEDFPAEDARELFQKIHDRVGAPSGVGNDEMRECFSWVWSLYWMMSSNNEHK
ncbi:hypothetical protein ACUTAH_00095 [Metapseudomonas furukawaii]|uniref:hypothetical protein n=1 Tax=Metapseudomonas furukawaii TaxID=1149133 RepID=UPI0040457EE7